MRVARSRTNRERFVGTWGPCRPARAARRDQRRRGVVRGAAAGRDRGNAAGRRSRGARRPTVGDRCCGHLGRFTVIGDPAHDVHEDPTGAIRIGWIDADAVEAWLGAPGLADFDLLVTGDPSAVEASARRSVCAGVVSGTAGEAGEGLPRHWRAGSTPGGSASGSA